MEVPPLSIGGLTWTINDTKFYCYREDLLGGGTSFEVVCFSLYCDNSVATSIFLLHGCNTYSFWVGAVSGNGNGILGLYLGLSQS